MGDVDSEKRNREGCGIEIEGYAVDRSHDRSMRRFFKWRLCGFMKVKG
jgi:hypothetical protein